MKIFAERLKELRIEKRLTQRALSEKTKLSQTAIKQWEKEQRVPNAIAVVILARFFSVTTDFLLGEKDY